MMKLMSYKTKIFHPFLLAIFPIIFLYSDTINEVHSHQMLIPIVLMLVISIVLVIMAKFIFKNWKKSALIISLILVLFILYSPVFANVSGASIGDFEVGKHRFLIIIFAVPILIAGYLLFKTRKKLDNITLILNIVTISLILISVANIGTYYVEGSIYENDNDIQIISGNLSYPDIYFIVYDAYSGEKVLKNYYNYDNHDFINNLREKGFFVHDESYSNYDSTVPSLGATFNMDYFDSNTEIKRVYAMFTESNAVKIINSMGYKIIDFQKHSLAVDLPIVDKKLCKKDNNRFTDTRLLDQLLKYTPLSVFIEINPPEQDRDTQICLFAELLNTQAMFEEPTFVFAHSLVTHPPYFYGPNGEALDSPTNAYDEHYVNAIKFANKNTIQIVDKLLDVENPPIIVISADHGTFRVISDNLTYEEKIRQQHQILYAVYFPDQNYELVKKTTTPINIFRIIFNQFFNTEYELLEDRTFSDSIVDANDLDETTDILINSRL